MWKNYSLNASFKKKKRFHQRTLDICQTSSVVDLLMNCSHPPTSQIKIREDFPKNTHIIAMKNNDFTKKNIGRHWENQFIEWRKNVCASE